MTKPKLGLAEKNFEEMRLALRACKDFSDLLIRDTDCVRNSLEEIRTAAIRLLNGKIKHDRLHYIFNRTTDLLQALNEKEFANFGLLVKRVMDEVHEKEIPQ